MYTRFCACKTVKGACLCMWDIVPVNEQACTLLMITWYSSRKFTKLALKLLAAKAPSLFQSCVLLLSSKLYYFSLHDNHPPFLYTVWSIYIAMLAFLINWNERSNIANVIYWLWTTNVFRKISVHLLLTQCRIPLSVWKS